MKSCVTESLAEQKGENIKRMSTSGIWGYIFKVIMPLGFGSYNLGNGPD